MSYPRQSSTLARLEEETRKAGRDQEDASIARMRQEWDKTKDAIRAVILSEYHRGHGGQKVLSGFSGRL